MVLVLFVALVPVRAGGKTRLDVPDRALLAEAFLADVRSALEDATQVGEVIVLDTPGGLVEAIAEGGQRAATRAPGAPVVVVPADLPTLTSEALDPLLQRARRYPSAWVRDHRGDGTTLLTARNPREIPARYGPQSAAAHASVATELRDADLRARLDDDTLADLHRAVDLGVGPATARVVGAAPFRTG